jgi:hypothetical protein
MVVGDKMREEVGRGSWERKIMGKCDIDGKDVLALGCILTGKEREVGGWEEE